MNIKNLSKFPKRPGQKPWHSIFPVWNIVPLIPTAAKLSLLRHQQKQGISSICQCTCSDFIFCCQCSHQLRQYIIILPKELNKESIKRHRIRFFFESKISRSFELWYSLTCFSFHGDQFCGVFRRSAPGSFRLRRGWIERAVVCRLGALRGSGRVWINRRSSLINTSSRCRRIYTVVKITTRVLSCTSKSQPCFKTILSPRMFSRLFSLSVWWRRRGHTAFAGKSSAVLFAGYKGKLDKCCYHCNLCATRFPPVPMPIGENPWWGEKISVLLITF